ncbi:transglycosylase domain-containing protein [Halobacillus amylolyticus]|uniref:PBP1A family penicillin-binding protein n=1 Tax=Halobacillus amylolyticus TaxID=2932259 RepID=A0ABY4HE87_9BACI|nr:PBP1A family penicillin-binding protein [Halobacillus amylolyticus]UOR13193.1 PBP1A family penicillin-binding protein [Halobacillus amylolyticus]
MNIKEYLKDRPQWLNTFKWPAIALGSIFLLALLGYLFIVFGGRFVVSEKDLILDAATTVETVEGEVIERIYTENRMLVDISQIPEHVQQAFVAIEDSRFYEHAGVDFKSVLRAVYRDIITMDKVEGASTITQQLAKNLFLSNDKSWMRKTKEVMAAIYLERNFTKDEILELYLNRIYFGNGAYGVEAASQTYFNKSVSELTVPQGALLAALPKAPNNYSPFENPERAEDRRNIVLSRMEAIGVIEAENMVSLQGATLGVEKGTGESETWSNSYVDLVIKEAAEQYHLSRDELKRGGYRLIVKMNPEIQEMAAAEMKNGEFVPGSKAEVEGAFTLMDNTSGAIVAAVGGRDFRHGDLNRVTIKKQPGSVIKPLAVYGPALMSPTYIPYSLLVDEKRSYGEYSPSNYDGNYTGLTSLYQALVDSKNAPAVWLLDQIGISYAKEYLDALGLPTEDRGLSIALGGLSKGYSPLQLTEAYRSFAHEGEVTNAYTIQRIINRNGEIIHRHEQKEKQVFNKQTAWHMTEMLETTASEGTAKAGSYPKALAGKTGTQQHPTVNGENKEVWFAGYTPEYTGTLWMGYDQSGEDYYLTGGSSYPTKLMKSILTRVGHLQNLSETFTKPEGMKRLPEPIILPKVDDVEGSIGFGGIGIIRGTLSWTPGEDDRVVYRIYQGTGEKRTLVDEVTGKGEYHVGVLDVWDHPTFVVVPYDPLTGLEGTPSNSVTLEW